MKGLANLFHVRVHGCKVDLLGKLGGCTVDLLVVKWTSRVVNPVRPVMLFPDVRKSLPYFPKVVTVKVLTVKARNVKEVL